jgi:crotonobetainyl-CoA:carnitine CoA-transferase CaiB-like acyl-CoA transferase
MEHESEGALTGYRVLDLSDVKGAYCTKLLADLGAEVIKVESPEGDPTRKLPPFAGDIPNPERSLPFLLRNANKLGITLNLQTEDGKHILRRLVESADVLVESFAPGVLTGLGLGLGYEALREINAGLIMASITEFGQTGPYRDWKGSPIVDMQHPVVGTFQYPGPPYKWTETPSAVRRPAPCLGEHNVAILCERLGFSRTELAALRRAGVV